MSAKVPPHGNRRQAQRGDDPSRYEVRVHAPSSAFAPPVVFVAPVTPCDDVAIVEASPAMPAARDRADAAAVSACGNVGGGGGGGGNCGCATFPPPNSDAIIPIESPVRLSASVQLYPVQRIVRQRQRREAPAVAQ